MAKQRNDTLATFTFLATFLVVMCHADDVLPFRTGPAVFLGGAFADANVYNFFWLSGYFLGKHIEEAHWWRTALFKRISTLAVPYVLWNGIYAILRDLSGRPFPIGARGIDKVFGILIGSTPVCYSMWYIKTLYLFVLASPLFAWGLIKFRSHLAHAILICSVVLLYVGVRLIGLPPPPLLQPHGIWSLGGFVPFGFLFFCIGLWLSQIRIPEHLQQAVKIHANSIAAVAFALWVFSAALRHYHENLAEMNILISSVCLFLISNAIKKLPDVLTRNSFFIYGSHLALLNALSISIPASLAVHSTLVYVFSALFVTAMAIIGGEVMRRITPTLYAPLVGGRV